MKVCKVIDPSQLGLAMYAFDTNLFDLNYFTGSWFTPSLFSLILFGENGLSAKQFDTVQNTLSPDTLSLGTGVQTKNRLEQAEAGRSPALLALRYATGNLRILRGYLKMFLAVK